ncbi:hypothetical protein T11_10799 [Trichinella zimbabwensis]|uniref:Uncharacterized protein n=1 Tax=Trichinella zimbabwensis TaxID=268475 RepID=A0A0V1GWS1_9BILA|nr:hypothetical protein T11_10799 [Trichinella zimbabwensis]
MCADFFNGNLNDLLSRGLTVEQLASYSFWWHGTAWVMEDRNHHFEDMQRFDRPCIFRRVFFTDLTNLSQYPPCHGARSAINFHSIRCLIVVRWISSKDGSENRFLSYRSAVLNVENLSGPIMLGYSRNISSKWMAWVTIRVYKQMYTFVHSSCLYSLAVVLQNLIGRFQTGMFQTFTFSADEPFFVQTVSFPVSYKSHHFLGLFPLPFFHLGSNNFGVALPGSDYSQLFIMKGIPLNDLQPILLGGDHFLARQIFELSPFW